MFNPLNVPKNISYHGHKSSYEGFSSIHFRPKYHSAFLDPALFALDFLFFFLLIYSCVSRVAQWQLYFCPSIPPSAPLPCPSATFSEVLLSWLPAFLLLSLAVTAGHHGRSTVTAASIATSEFLQRIQMTEGVPDTHFVRTTDLGVHPGPHRVSPSQVI